MKGLPALAMASMLLLLAVSPALFAASQRDEGVVILTQANRSQWRTVYFSKSYTAPPVVIAGPASYNNTDPTTVRVRNVTAVSFDIQLAEWDYLDGAHPAETVGWIALEPGIHTIGSSTWEAGRVSGVTGTPATVSLTGSFAAVPLVMTQVESTANPQALISRVNSVTSGSFAVRIAAQKSFHGTLSGESICYVAMKSGNGTVDGHAFSVVTTGTAVSNVTNATRTVTLSSGKENATFFAAGQTYNEVDPFAIRFTKNAGSLTVNFFLEEDNSDSSGVTHNAGENVGYLAIALLPGEDMANIETGWLSISQATRSQWQTLTFSGTYTNPIVVFGPVSENNSDPVGVRVSNVTGTNCQYQLSEWAYEDGVHPQELVSYIVMEAGDYNIGGLRWYAGQQTGVTQTPVTVTLPAPNFGVPVVLAQVASNNDSTPVNQRTSSIATGTFTLQLEEEENGSQTHGAETVNYIAITKGNARFSTDGVVFEANDTLKKVSQTYYTTAFARNFAYEYLLGNIQTFSDADPVVLRYGTLTGTSAQFRSQEETSQHADVTHSNETVGYLSIASGLDLDEDGISDAWELSHGLNPNNPADAQSLYSGSNGLTNVQEFRAEITAGLLAVNSGTIGITADLPSAYRHEGTNGRITVTRSGGTAAVTVNYTTSGTAALGTDYVVTDASGVTLSGSLIIPANTNTAYLMIKPLVVSTHNYPEPATITLSTGSTYTVDSSNNTAVVTVNDAADTPANQQLFVAHLTPAPGVTSLASGVATMHVNGPNTVATVDVNFSDLTSGQTNDYLRYGGTGTELRPNLGSGPIVDAVWNIGPVSPYSGQNIVDALNQASGQFAFINIGTVNYPSGEIQGTWARQTGSGTFTPPGNPPPITPLTGSDLTRDVARFLTQTTFGAKKADVDALVAMVNGAPYNGDRIAAFSAWIDSQLAMTQSNLYDYVNAANGYEWNLEGVGPTYGTNGTYKANSNDRYGWWFLSVAAPDQLRQRFAFAMSQIIVVSKLDVKLDAYPQGTASFYDMLGRYATGNFRNLIGEVSTSPVMGEYLSSLKNTQAEFDPVTGEQLTSPDENYAREVMQLFTIGLLAENPDGSLKLDSSGEPIANYGQNDITELARVFTGWSFGSYTGTRAQGFAALTNTDFNLGNPSVLDYLYSWRWIKPMANFGSTYHDTGAKTVLGTAIAGGLSGQADLDAALNIICNHPNVGPFICRQLIERLVTSNPSPGYVYRVAQVFNNSGSGTRGDMKAVIKAILLDYEARELSLINNVSYGKKKEPIILYTGLLRALGGHSNMHLSDLAPYYVSSQYSNFPSGATLFRFGTMPGLVQTPQTPPSVFNWFLPDYNPGGIIGAAGLVAPEMQITTETTSYNLINNMNTLTTGGAAGGQAIAGYTTTADAGVSLDFTPLTTLYDAQITAGQTVTQATTTLLDYLDVLLMNGNFKAKYATAPTPNPRSIIISSVSGMSLSTSAARMQELLYLVATSPEFIVQK